jgi:hypothetical protein
MTLDIQSINAAVRAGNIDAARRILKTSDDPRAAAMLVKLNAKYPPAPLAADSLAEVKALIAQKKFDEAESLLWSSDVPEAAGLLKKIALVRSVQPQSKGSDASASGVPIKPKEKPRSTTLRNVLLVAVVVVLCVCGAFYYDAKQRSDAAGLEIGMLFDIQDVCYEVYRDDMRHVSADAFYDACEQEAEAMIVFYRATAERCYKEWKDETFKEMECLVDGGASFGGTYMMIADAKSR